MQCPKCGTALRAVVYEGASIHTCDGCGGEVITPDALRHVVETRDKRFSPELQAQLAERTPTFGVPVDECDRSLSCPACAGSMRVVNYCGDSGVYIDRCERCTSTFLDHEELEKVQAIMEKFEDEAPEQLRAIAGELEQTRRETAEASSRAFAGSRFSFINAVINRFLDAA